MLSGWQKEAARKVVAEISKFQHSKNAAIDPVTGQPLRVPTVQSALSRVQQYWSKYTGVREEAQRRYGARSRETQSLAAQAMAIAQNALQQVLARAATPTQPLPSEAPRVRPSTQTSMLATREMLRRGSAQMSPNEEDVPPTTIGSKKSATKQAVHAKKKFARAAQATHGQQGKRTGRVSDASYDEVEE